MNSDDKAVVFIMVAAIIAVTVLMVSMPSVTNDPAASCAKACPGFTTSVKTCEIVDGKVTKVECER